MAGNNGSGRNKIVPKRGELHLAEEQQSAQAKLRTAVFNAISESDVAEVVKGIVKNAKAGDRVALKYLFDYILGGRVTTAIQNNVYVDGVLQPDEPTDAGPGTSAKIEAMRNRAATRQGLFTSNDEGTNILG